jgi:diacylglycerol kinase (ATP)
VKQPTSDLSRAACTAPVWLLFNPAAGRGAVDLQRHLSGVDNVRLSATRDAADVTAQARRAAAAGHERLIFAGGDGTLHCAIQGLAGSRCALGIVPLGSGNDVARALKIPLKTEPALALALSGTPRTIDLGTIEDRSFLLVAGLGIDSDVNRFIEERMRLPRGPWIYPYATLRTLLAFAPPRVSIESDEGRYEGRVVLAALANAPCFGGGMQIAPRAELDDAWLDVVIVEWAARLRLLTVLPRVYRGSHIGHPLVKTFRTRRARLRADRPVMFYADGEPIFPVQPEGTTVAVRPQSLRVVTPDR